MQFDQSFVEEYNDFMSLAYIKLSDMIDSEIKNSSKQIDDFFVITGGDYSVDLNRRINVSEKWVYKFLNYSVIKGDDFLKSNKIFERLKVDSVEEVNEILSDVGSAFEFFRGNSIELKFGDAYYTKNYLDSLCISPDSKFMSTEYKPGENLPSIIATELIRFEQDLVFLRDSMTIFDPRILNIYRS